MGGRIIYSLDDLGNSRIKLTKPLSITLVINEDEVIAKCKALGLYGSGKQPQDAINELCKSIVDYYETLSEERDRLGPLPQGHWEFLKGIIEEEGKR